METRSLKKNQIQLTDSVPDILVKLSEGNPGACSVLVRLVKEGAEIDPESWTEF